MSNPFAARSLEFEAGILALPDWPETAFLITTGDLAAHDWVGGSGVHVIFEVGDDREQSLKWFVETFQAIRDLAPPNMITIVGLSDLQEWAEWTTDYPFARCRTVRGEAKLAPGRFRPAEIREAQEEKHRHESARVSPQVRTRHVRLADGGLDDLVYLTNMIWLARDWQDDGVNEPRMPARLRLFAEHQRIHAWEHDQLLHAWTFLKQLEAALYELGIGDQILPENPDKLAAVAERIGAEGANPLLSQFLECRETVRSLHSEFSERGFV